MSPLLTVAAWVAAFTFGPFGVACALDRWFR
jgi:hypothetical protein